MVAASLGKARHDWFDLLNLISPAAYPLMGAMRDAAQIARRRYYGKTVSVYAPLYIGNTCINSCRYCDFRIQHTGTVRRNLSLDEIRREAEAIRAEERVLFLRRKALENKADRLAQYLEIDLNGENFKTARVVVKWRPSVSTEISDEFLPWAKENGLTSLIRTKEEPDKTAIGKLLKAGQTFPGAQLVTHNNMSIK